MTDFDLHPLLDAVAEQGRAEARGRSVHLDVCVEHDVPRRLSGDPDRLRLLLHLLVGHALSAADEGAVRLTVRRTPSENGTVSLRFEVQDGSSSPETCASFFDEITHGDASGVDLSLWRQLVPSAAASWGVEGSSESGGVLWFVVALEGAADGAPTVPPAGDASGDGAREVCTRVLVVEDNIVNQKVAEQLIRKLGYAVDVVGDGRQAVQRLERETYGLILMDCQMPVMDGYEATAEIRRREGAARRTPIVAFTAHVLAANRDRCMQIGMDGFMTKPVTSEALRSVIESWIPRAPLAG